MESNFHGDLADIFRPGTVNSGDPPGVSDWHYTFNQSEHNQEPQEPQMIQKSTPIQDDQDHFGQPFTSLLTDPFLHEGSSSSLFTTTRSSSSSIHDHNHNQDHNQNHNIFSKMLQISPAAINGGKASSCSNSSSSSSKRSLLEASTSLQISSPRNPGIKRRKNQAKKVVCIPAPTPANSRPTGEVVPSDLWAWRKYGQKPIKGSPYPRGYYRCSSSKGCSARKQVERSRTDPNMLVITYTSEHNHPWPTQRNALAGSTRTPQPPKKEATVGKQPPAKEATAGDQEVQVKDELQVLEEGFHQGYRPEFHGGNGDDQPEDFFSGLGEIEVDPISLLLNQGFLGGDEDEENYKKDLNPFD